MGDPTFPSDPSEGRGEVQNFIDAFGDVATTESLYFIIGGYGDERIERLRLVESEINKRSNGRSFLLHDVDVDISMRVAFSLAADLADYIVAVVEESSGGVGLELGELMESSNYQKTHVLKREYSSPAKEREAFSVMTQDFFQMIASDGRLCHWKNSEELRGCINVVPGGDRNEQTE